MVAGGRIRFWPRLVYSEHAVPRVMPRGRAASADFTIDISPSKCTRILLTSALCGLSDLWQPLYRSQSLQYVCTHRGSRSLVYLWQNLRTSPVNAERKRVRALNDALAIFAAILIYLPSCH